MMQRQEEQSGDRRRMWLGRRASVLLAACASVLTLGMFAAVAVTVFNDSGGLTAPDASGLRIAQGHEEAGRNPLRSAEDAETDAPNTRIALAHTTAMQSPWQKIANDITSVIAPAYRAGRGDRVLGVAKTKLVDFESVLFPYDGPVIGTQFAAMPRSRSTKKAMHLRAAACSGRRMPTRTGVCCSTSRSRSTQSSRP